MAGAALAADRSAGVPDATLQNMGFGAARVMTDAEGGAVRGRGYFAFTFSRATVNGVTKTRVDFAPPGHVAFTRAFVTNGTLFAGGHSFAYAR